jgi:hypothetical protein
MTNALVTRRWEPIDEIRPAQSKHLNEPYRGITTVVFPGQEVTSSFSRALPWDSVAESTQARPVYASALGRVS